MSNKKSSTKIMKNYENNKLEISSEFTNNTEVNCNLATNQSKYSKKVMNKNHRKVNIEKSEKGK